jgi:hypothetical protein
MRCVRLAEREAADETFRTDCSVGARSLRVASCSCGEKWQRWAEYKPEQFQDLAPDEIDEIKLELTCMAFSDVRLKPARMYGQSYEPGGIVPAPGSSTVRTLS